MPSVRDQMAADLVAEIRAYCREHADPKGATKFARYFKEGYDAWGLLDKNHPVWNEKQAEWLERYHDLGPAGFLRAGELLFQSGKYEEGGLAIRFLARRSEELDSKALPKLARWFSAGIANWAHTDVLCSEVISPMLESGQIGLEALGGWRESPHKFQRRAVPVAMLGLLSTPAAAGDLLEFVRPLMMDPERVVQQGLGWLLREMWKKEPRPVERFLLEWKDQAPRVIFQYATEKMPAAAKARFRRARPSR